MLHVLLPVAGVEVNIVGLAALGLIIGGLAGFLGVGGGFILTPMLNVIFGIPYNVAVGSGLSQMLGMSLAGSIRHSKHGNIDYKLVPLLMVAIVAGVECGARVLQALKQSGAVSVFGRQVPLMWFAMSLIYIALLTTIGLTMLFESVASARQQSGRPASDEPKSRLSQRLHDLKLPPVIALPASGIGEISLWVILGLGLVAGFFAGLLGLGGGFILVPTLIYVVGCPTPVAVGSSFCVTLIAAAFGAFTHALKGNVDLLLVMPLLLGSTIGAQVGAAMTRRVKPTRLRTIFSLLALAAMGGIALKLIIRLAW